MFLTGKFNRYYFSLGGTDNPLNEARIRKNMTREILQQITVDEDFQVINLETLEYFDPKQNKWIKIKEA